MAHHVFISYRRKGGAELARLLYDRLQADGYQPFYDITSLEIGYFDLQIYDRINECECVLVLLSPNALEPVSDGKDWFLTEITHAMQQNKKTIPILMRDFKWPERSSDVISHLRHCHGIEETMDYFNAFYSKIKSIIPYTPTVREAALPMTVQMDKRLRMADTLLENGNFKEAEVHFRTLLEYDLECGAAYLGLTMVQHGIRNREAFRDYYSQNLLYDHINIKLARQHGDPQTREYLDSLSLPVCQSHRHTARFRCERCGALLCDDCASHLPAVEGAWFSERTLCPDCADLIRAGNLAIEKKNRRSIFLRFLAIAAYLALLPVLQHIFSLKSLVGPFIVEGFIGGGVSLFVQNYRNCSTSAYSPPSFFDTAASVICGIISTPLVLILWLLNGITGLLLMHFAAKRDQAARERNKDAAAQYAASYQDMVHVWNRIHNPGYRTDRPTH